MNTLDIAVVGSGIGGSLIASLNAHKKIALFEKDKNLGGCTSTFKRYGNYYNTGATTLVGYEDDHIVKKQFDQIGLIPNISKSKIAIRVVQNNHIIDRIKDFKNFLTNINEIYPNKNNTKFWEKIQKIDTDFWKLKKIYYAKYSAKKYIKTGAFIAELLATYKWDLFKSADSFIKEILGDISSAYKKFIDAQLLITIQTTSSNISLLSLALGLSYPFHDVFYVHGGMGTLIEDIVKNIEVKKDEAIVKIIKEKDHWIINSTQDQYRTKQLVLNSSIYQTADLFDDPKIKKYYNSFSFSDQSAFVLYLTLQSDLEFLEHYQFIYDEIIPNCISNSFFISFSRKDDRKLSKNGYSITISTHSKASLWQNLSKEDYEKEKEKTQRFILDKFLEYFTTLTKKSITKYFSATALTFNRYIGRYNCGGKAIGFKNITQMPSCNTPFNNLYNIGDTVFAGQGWPGVALGVDVLQKELNGTN
ncbi:MAG: NAD(P)-binding protein [Arcobacteraceae bacterium]